MTKENRFDTKEWTAPVIEKIPAWVADTEDVAILLTDREKMEWEFLPEPILEIPSPFAVEVRGVELVGESLFQLLVDA